MLVGLTKIFNRAVSGPDRVKTRREFGNRKASGCERDRDLANVEMGLGIAGTRRRKPCSGPHCLHQGIVTQYFHDSLQVVGQNMKSHFRAHPIQGFGQEMGIPHP